MIDGLSSFSTTRDNDNTGRTSLHYRLTSWRQTPSREARKAIEMQRKLRHFLVKYVAIDKDKCAIVYIYDFYQVHLYLNKQPIFIRELCNGFECENLRALQSTEIH